MRAINKPILKRSGTEYSTTILDGLFRRLEIFFNELLTPGDLRCTELTITNAPTYADNTAALAGGLVVGQTYKTAAGDLRIVV